MLHGAYEQLVAFRQPWCDLRQHRSSYSFDLPIFLFELQGHELI